jgi:hypothetical protein
MLQRQQTQTGFHMRITKLFILVILASCLATSCAVNPVTGKNELSIISESQELGDWRSAIWAVTTVTRGDLFGGLSTD